MSNESTGSRELNTGSVEQGHDERLKALIQHSFDVITLIGPDGTVEYVSPSISRVLGYTPDEFVRLNGFEQVHPNDVEEFRRRFGEVLKVPEASLAIEVRLRHKNGSWRWVESRVTNLREEPTVRAVVLNFRDVTDRKLVQEELTDFVENATVGLHWVGPNGTILWANEADFNLLGYTREEYVGRNIAEFHADPPVIADILRRLTGNEELHSYEARLRCMDGSIRHVLISSSVFSRDGKFVHTRCFTRDITEHRMAEGLRKRLAAIVESSDDIIASKTLDGVITSWNRGAEKVLGYTAEEVIGRHVSMLMPPELIEDMPRILDRIRKGEKVDHYETRRRRKDGTIIDVSLTVSPIRDASGRVVEASKIGRDITHEKLIEAERKEADRRKDEFLAMLAHELRNPLSAINNAAQLFGKLETEEELVWAKDVVQRQVKHLSRLIDDLLDVSRISRGKIGLKKEPLSLSPVVSSAVEAVRPLLEERKHELSVSLTNEGLRLEADPLRLEQILVNLLTNAAKYTDAGGKISLTTRHEGGDIVIEIRDTGMGIMPELMPRIFDLFAQGDRTAARSEGGLGIGLTLVQKLVEMYGGSVNAASEGPGKGSEFTVRLPALEEPSVREPGPGGAPPRAARQSSRVLVVDDNFDNARTLSRLLRLLGHDVRVAYDGHEAIEVARVHRPEIVLLDIGLPVMDGYEVAKRLRTEEGCREALIIAVSGYGQPEDLSRSKEAGFDHHLIKPVDYDALMILFAAQPS